VRKIGGKLAPAQPVRAKSTAADREPRAKLCGKILTHHQKLAPTPQPTQPKFIHGLSVQLSHFLLAVLDASRLEK
jgi:hypothetical protein